MKWEIGPSRHGLLRAAEILLPPTCLPACIGVIPGTVLVRCAEWYFKRRTRLSSI